MTSKTRSLFNTSRVDQSKIFTHFNNLRENSVWPSLGWWPIKQISNIMVPKKRLCVKFGTHNEPSNHLKILHWKIKSFW